MHRTARKCTNLLKFKGVLAKDIEDAIQYIANNKLHEEMSTRIYHESHVVPKDYELDRFNVIYNDDFLILRTGYY